MIYPLLPAYIATVLGAGPAFLGAIEGAAEATASLLKLVSGIWADRLAHRKPLVVLGYALSAIARPLVAIATSPWHVLAVRITDRVGKGLRTSPRDAVVADVTTPQTRGRAFGFHRAMDHTGAVIGPLVAIALLHVLGPGERSLRIVFACAAVPGVLAMLALVFGLVEPKRAERAEPRPHETAAPLGPQFRKYLAVLLVFTLGNSSDAFLLLRASEEGVPAIQLPLIWVALHVVKSALSTWFGGLSDRLGRKRTIAAGWTVYAACYGLFAVAGGQLAIWGVFGLYGVYFALTEGAEKALCAELVPAESRGRAFGLFHATVGLGALPASIVFGAIWQRWSSAAAFGTGAVLALVAAVLLATLVRGQRAQVN
ncbi:MAG: MFS transporter [Deltaproteobacteria bacterium]|nr:MFS transporter [Deltaproteobacteria bacterium]